MNMGTFGAMDQKEMMEVNGGVKFSPFGAGCFAFTVAIDIVSEQSYTHTAHKGGRTYKVSYSPNADSRAFAKGINYAVGGLGCFSFGAKQ